MAATGLDATTTSAAQAGRSALIGAQVARLPVRDGAGQEVGAIERLLIDLNSGQIVYAVLSGAAGSGTGAGYVTLPWSALNFDPGSKTHEVKLTGDQFARVPRRAALWGEDPSAERDWDEHVRDYFNTDAFPGEGVAKATHEARS